MILMQIFLKREIGIFIDFINILEDEGISKQTHKNSHRFPFDWNLTYFWGFYTNGTAEYASFKSILHIRSPYSTISLNRKRPSILKWAYEIYLLTFLSWLRDGFPHPFSLLKSECLRTNTLVSLSKNLYLSLTFP